MLGPKEEDGPGVYSQLAYLLLCHLLFVLIAGLVLLLALPVARAAGSTIGLMLVGALGIALIVQYQRVAGIARRVMAGWSAHRSTKLPESYVAGLAICHFAPLLVLLSMLDGALWLQQQAVIDLASVDELVQHEPEGVYRVDQARSVRWLGLREFRRSLGNQLKVHANQDKGTAWQVIPLVSDSKDREEVNAAIAAGSHCVWLGSKSTDSNDAARLGSDQDQYFMARDTRDMRRYFDVLREGLERAELPPCTRIVAKMAAPEEVMATYRRHSLIALALAHGIPAMLMLLFSWFSGGRRPA